MLKAVVTSEPGCPRFGLTVAYCCCSLIMRQAIHLLPGLVSFMNYLADVKTTSLPEKSIARAKQHAGWQAGWVGGLAKKTGPGVGCSAAQRSLCTGKINK